MLHHGAIISKWVRRSGIKDGIFYTYWFERITYGLARYKVKSGSTIPLVSRAHRYDLYEGRRKHKFIPFRNFTLNQLDQLFSISNDGYRYLKYKYPHFHLVSISRLGVPIQTINNENEDSTSLTIASCSSVIALKRLDMIFDLLNKYAQKSGVVVVWHHFGDGPLLDKIKEQTFCKSSRLSVQFHGELDNHEILNFYKNHKIDCFINLSESEGIPVSIMEAISFGIPILARNVGGMKEIVTHESGILLQPNPSSDEALIGLKVLIEKRLSSSSIKDFFEENYSAKKNFGDFYNKLVTLK